MLSTGIYTNICIYIFILCLLFYICAAIFLEDVKLLSFLDIWGLSNGARINYGQAGWLNFFSGDIYELMSLIDILFE